MYACIIALLDDQQWASWVAIVHPWRKSCDVGWPNWSRMLACM